MFSVNIKVTGLYFIFDTVLCIFYASFNYYLNLFAKIYFRFNLCYKPGDNSQILSKVLANYKRTEIYNGFLTKLFITCTTILPNLILLTLILMVLNLTLVKCFTLQFVLIVVRST